MNFSQYVDFASLKVGAHEGTSHGLVFRTCLLQGLHHGTSRGDKSLEGFTRGDLLHIEIAKVRALSLKFREAETKKERSLAVKPNFTKVTVKL